jgi:hypothetical protein
MGYVKQETGTFNSSLIVIVSVAFVRVAIGGSFGSKRSISPGAESGRIIVRPGDDLVILDAEDIVDGVAQTVS